MNEIYKVSLPEIYLQFIEGFKQTTLPEYVAVITGIASVWFSRKENILVYPVGLISTTIYIYLSTKASLPGEAGVNLYYTIMSFYGWMLWMKKDTQQHKIIVITHSTGKEWVTQVLFFLACYLLIFTALIYLKKSFTPGAIPWADGFASATAFTGMWLMAKKKVESWYWWIATNIASIPLYFVKQFIFTSVYYFILLIFAFWGLAEWNKRAQRKNFQPAFNAGLH